MTLCATNFANKVKNPFNGEPIKLPDNLESLPRADSFPSQRHRWNTNEEIAAILISFDKHSEWQSKEVKTRPKSGSMLLYSRKKVRYRRDGYCWKKRKDGKTTREDHMKLKVQGTECIYGCYVHSAILPTFHRRCYWLLQNPDIVLVHYLNVPYPDDNKMAVLAPSITLWGDKKEWTKEELVSQLKPMLSTVTSDDDSDSGNDIEISHAETVETIVCQLMEKQRISRQAALVKQLDCGCGDASCADGKTCSHPVMRRPNLLKSASERRVNLNDNYNQAVNGTPNVVVGPKLYSRWSERRTRDSNSLDNQQYHAQQLAQESAIKFQIIPPQHNEQSQQQQQLAVYQQQQQQQQVYRQQSLNSTHQLLATRSNLIVHQHQQQTHQQQQQQQQHQLQQLNQTGFNQAVTTTSTIISSNNNNNNQINLQRFVANHNSNSSSNSNNNNNNSLMNNRLQIARTTITTTNGNGLGNGVATQLDNGATVNDAEIIENENHMSTNFNATKINRNTNCNNSNNNNNNNHQSNNLQLSIVTQQQQQQQSDNLNAINNNSNVSNNSNYNYNHNQQHRNQTQQQFFRLQQNQTTSDIKISPQQLHQQQHPKSQQQTSQMSHTTTNSSSSTVEPMCMSPEHHPSPPLHSTSDNNHSNNNNTNSNPLVHFSFSTSPSQSQTTTTSNSNPTLAHSLMDGNHVNPKQSTTINSDSTVTTSADENLISSHGTVMSGEMTASNVDDENANNQTVEMSTNDNNGNQHLNSSNINNNKNQNNINNNKNNNQPTEYNSSNSSNKSLNGCAKLGASSNISTVDCNNSNSSNSSVDHPGNDGRTEQNSVEFIETMDMNNGNEQQLTEHTSHELQESLGFFNETLDLSQEDIQRTLIANMPFSNGSVKQQNSTLLMGTSICIENNESEIPVTSVTGGDDEDAEDVFANLDAFDMLVEFPELDLDDKQALNNTALGHTVVLTTNDINRGEEVNIVARDAVLQRDLQYHETDSHDTHAVVKQQCNKKLLNICDFSPEWSYPEGGVKVLVAGPWTAASTYTVLFDAQPVPTVLIQEGVLRCYCPAHEVGFVSLQVSCDGFVISNAVMFEYKMSYCQEAQYDVTSNDCLYKFSLLNRLTSIEEKLQIKTESGIVNEQHAFYMQTNFEEKLINYCHQLTKRTWPVNTNSNWNNSFKGMTLLHLASALGYAKLMCAMLNWRSENPNIILETEIDALSQDIHGNTPMAWACARGHIETATILYKWNHNALKIKNNLQQSPLEIATAKGHKHLLAEIYRLENERRRNQNSGSLSSLSLNLTKYIINDIESKTSNPNEELFEFKEEHIFPTYDTIETHKSHDGVFLRPVALASNQSPPNNTRYSKRSSIDSGINMDIRTKPGKSFKDANKLHSFDAHDNYGLESPLDSLTGTNTTNSLLSPLRKMDFALCEVSTGDSSPLPDKDHDDTSTINNDDITDVTIGNETDVIVGDSDAKVLTLAEHIIAAMPERIKNEADEMMVLGSPMTEPLNTETSGLNDNFMDTLLDSLPNTHFDSDFSFEYNNCDYRYHDVSTPCSSLSPASSGPLQSPASYSILGHDPSVSSPSPPPSTKQLTEFLNASSSNQYPFEADFSKLTLTDTEQRELYEAAKCIQKAYRSYKGRQKLEEQNKERTAAIVIQNYYRRYKQYAYYRQMTNAALVIQHGYRSYRRNKRFKKSKSSTTSSLTNLGSQHSNNSQCLSSFYDHYKNDQQQEYCSSQPSTPKETSPSGPLKRTYSQSTQNQAARKIQQFMRQSRINIWDGNTTILTAERTSRKREAGAPTPGGVPSKLAVSRTSGNCLSTRKK
ncbi:uncharacterized protein LOC119674648 [Teleopsis dalmanni]|uniref:uncharacterized protein LOC119674648 n=1 Tax=Teleopsis dalmanni TaxID=139649 RepID=UPI0018CD7A11|nr:uncharacterized protein LOC119674648 [Teleopsis dalmanni]